MRCIDVDERQASVSVTTTQKADLAETERTAAIKKECQIRWLGCGHRRDAGTPQPEAGRHLIASRATLR
jgi:hypothetical protein